MMREQSDGVKEEKIRDALIALYLKQVLPMLLGQSFASAILIYAVLLHGRQSHLDFLSIWLLVNALFSLAIVWIVYLIKKDAWHLGGALWLRVWIVATLLFGLLWAAVVPLFMDVSNLYSLMLFTVLVLSVVSATLYGMSILQPLFYMFAGPILISYLFTLYAEDNFLEIILGGGVLTVLWGWVSRHIYMMTYELFSTRIENSLLLESLKQEKELVERASRAKTHFLSAASHDLRQPLQAQRLFAEAIESSAKEAELKEISGYMIESQRTMQSMLDVLLDISQLDAGVVVPKPEMVSLYALFSTLEQDFRPLAAEKNLLLYVRWPSRDAVVMADLGLLESILRNLLSNAIRYTETGTVMLGLRKRQQYWRLEVRDSGIGIAENQQKEIFEEFRQLNNSERDRTKGLGLGLSIVYRLCQLLDYNLGVYSQAGLGAVFSFEVPVYLTDHHYRGDIRGELNMQLLHGLNVLIVDDDVVVRKALQISLRGCGFSVSDAANASAAVECAQHQQPDVMIVDYRLSDQDTGLALIEVVRNAIGMDVPAMLLTGDTAPVELQRLHDVIGPVLHKPVSMHKLLLTMQLLLHPDSVAKEL